MEAKDNKKMEDKYLQISIQKSQKILRCITLRPEQPDQEFCDILIIYRNMAQVFNVDVSHQSVQVSTVATYPLFVPIVWCCILGEYGDHIAAVTADAHLLMLNAQPPFKKVSQHLMSTDLSPSTIPIAHCAANPSGAYIVACGFTENIIIVTFDSQDQPSLQKIKLPDFFVYEVVPTDNPNIFSFLVAFKSGEKYVISFDITEFVETNRILVPNDSISITSIFNNEGYSKTVLFTSNSILILGEPQIIYEVESRVHSWLVIPPNRIILQLLNKKIIEIKTDEKVKKDRGSLPLISTFCHLSNNLLFCVSAENDSFFLPSSNLSVTNAVLVEFDLLPKTSIPLTPRITSAVFHGPRLILSSSGFGEDDGYLLSAIYNSLPCYNNQIDQEATMKFRQEGFSDGQEIRFFSALPDCLVVSSIEKSVSLKGHLNISPNPTLALGKFGKSVLQVHTKGLRLINGNEYHADTTVTAVAIGEQLVIAAFSDNYVRLFDQDLNMCVEKLIYNAHAFAFCKNSIAIATEPEEGGNSTVTLYTFDLNPTDDAGQLSSRAFAMLFQQASMELFISTINGSVFRYIVGSSFSTSCAQIYSGEGYPLLLPYSDFVIIVTNDTFLFNGFKLLSVGFKNLRAITTISGEGLIPPSAPPKRLNDDQGDSQLDQIYVLDENNIVRNIILEDTEKDLTIKSFNPSEMPRKTACLNDEQFLCITRRVEEDHTFCSTLIIANDPGNDSADLDHRSIVFKGREFGAISLELIEKDLLAIGFVTADNTGQICLINPTTQILVWSMNLPKPPFAIRKAGPYLFVGVGQQLHYVRPIQSDDNQLFEFVPLPIILPTAICFIEHSGHYLYLADRVESVFVYRYDADDKQGIQVALIAIDTTPRHVTSMTLINEYTVAVGEKNGTITILRLPNDAIGDTKQQWRVSIPPARGISIHNPVGQLIKAATFCVSEAVTSLIMGSQGTLFYTSLLGQIGALIPLDSDEHYLTLLNAEYTAEQLSMEEFGLTITRKVPMEKISVVSCDIIDLIQNMSKQGQKKFESSTNSHFQSLLGLTCMIKQKAKF